MTSILAFLFVLGVLIFVHELGHFMMARRIGVRVLTFSLGFGPKLLSFKRGDTEYAVSAIPLGGYVKMAGENPEDARTGAADEFLSKSKWQRFQVLIMGPVMNLMLAFVVMALVLYQGARVPAFEDHPVIIGSFAADSMAPAAGLQVGDRIVMVDGERTPTWEDFAIALLPKAGRRVSLVIERGGQTLEKEIVPAAVGKFDEVYVGIEPPMRPQIAELNAGEPGAEAGLRPGDVILAVGGERGVSRDRIVEVIKANEHKPLLFEIERDGRIERITATPRKTDDLVRIGAQITPYELKTVNPNLVQSFKLSAERNWEWTQLIVKTLVGLFTRDTSVKQLMGPVAIADLSGTAAERGWIPLFSLMAMISLNLGLLNLMPIPVLDGGHIAILAMEGLSRRDFSMKVKEKMLLAGFVLLLMLMVTVIYNDLTRVQWIEKLMPWR
ncbi:MAG TPA: RIP metalloprotease RseP [Vicinamibacterales bacterium]|jgi:regulator of sigma E protease|nr:RIP metalloprotease RseP [Vicinamibacterales bacterium]